jgi:hypothetical protein
MFERIKISEDEKVLKGFSLENSFYLMSYNKKLKQINLLNFLNEKEFIRHTFTVDKIISQIFTDSRFYAVKNQQGTTFENLASSKKIFAGQKDHLYLIADNEVVKNLHGGTQILHFDLSSDHLDYQYINGAARGTAAKSWYLDGKVVRFVRSREMLSFQFYDVVKKQTIKQLNYQLGDSIPMVPAFVVEKKTDVKNDHRSNVSSVKIAEGESEKFIMLSSGDPFVHFERTDDGQIAFLAGTYKERTVTLLPQNPYDPTSRYKSNNGNVTLGNNGQYFSMGPSQPDKFLETKWFSCKMEDSTFTVLPSPCPIPKPVKIEEAIQRLQIKEARDRNLFLIYQQDKFSIAYLLYQPEMKIMELSYY